MVVLRETAFERFRPPTMVNYTYTRFCVENLSALQI